MNKEQIKTAKYATAVNQLIDSMEKNQSEMNPYFEKIKAAITDNKLADFSDSDYTETQKVFAAGVADYNQALTMFKETTAPAKMIGNKHQMVKAFQQFVDDCQTMLDSLQPDKKVDIDAFNESEAAQDQDVEKISKLVQKISMM